MTPNSESLPRVSVILLSYNYAAYLSEALASVFKQTHPVFECLVVDDGSTDGSWDMLLQWQARYPAIIRLFMHPGRGHCGLVASYRLALSKVTGDMVAFIESDDLWEKKNLEDKIRMTRKYPEAGVVYADYRPFGLWRGVFYWGLYAWANRLTTPANKPFDALPLLLKRNIVASFTHFMVRRKLLAGIAFPPDNTKNFDWWVLAHLAAVTRFCFIPRRLTRWRIHPQSAAYGRITLKSLHALSVFLVACYRSLMRREDFKPACEKKMRARFYLIRAFQKNKKSYVLFKLLRFPVSTLRFLIHILLRNCLFPERALELSA